jgi:asparagine synthase (glutamine-hydrolysing)
MCGISGRYNFDGRPVSAAEITVMRDVLQHRGPDDAGLHVCGPIGLGHRRLSIIDLAGGRQPIDNEDGSLTIVFNGEIYNFNELREDLLARCHTFKTHSDTEVIVHLYEEMGTECLQRLRGMFAFALWDAKRRQLFLARDRLGEKPLYYAASGQSLIFASEIKSLLRAQGMRASVSPVGLRRYLNYRYPYGNATLMNGIQPLPPGSYIVADARGWQVRRYWDVPLRAAAPAVRHSSDELLASLEQSVAQRMISDVPIGAFLSGGLDSSVVTALMARHTDQVRTFSIGFVPGDENELTWARRMSEACGARHHEFMQGPEDFFALLQKLVWHHDEPLTFPASIALYLLSRESKQSATVMLAGEGADELLAGYGNNIRAYWLARAAGMVPFAARRAVCGLPLPARLAGIAGRAALTPQQLILSTFKIRGGEELARHCRVALPAQREDDAQLLEEIGLSARDGSFLDRLLYFQLKTYLIALLMKQDKMSMAASIETRAPYLDHGLVELAFSLPDTAKIHGRTGKHLLRRAGEGLLPREIIHRPKQGFPMPIAQWFRAPGNPFIDILLDPQSLRDGLLDAAYVRGRVERFLAGEPASIEIWAMLNLELWRRSFLAAQAVPVPAQVRVSPR